MTEMIWKKYEKLKEIDGKNVNVKTYSARTTVIVKEIKPKDKYDYILIIQRLEELKLKSKIYDIIEENESIYVVLEDEKELNAKIDQLFFSEELDIKKEGVIEGHCSPLTKNEIFELFKMEKSMCKIESRTKDNKKKKGSGFFCKFDDSFPLKYALFTNNHILDETNLEIGKTIKFEYLQYQNSSYNQIKKEIKITDKRRVFTDKEFDYTCIELLESDGIKDYFEVDPDLYKYNNKDIIKNNDIFILQFPNGSDLSFSYGRINSLYDNIIIHNASTEGGSSGSPIIRRNDNNYVIGLHYGGRINKEKDKYLYNVATNFAYILDNIKTPIKGNEINCIYIANQWGNEQIHLLHDYNEDTSTWNESNYKKVYLEAKDINKNLYENDIEIYVNNKKIDIDCKYKMKELKEIKVKFKINKKIMNNTSFMFYKCSSLKSIDLSLFDARYVTKMRSMFEDCISLESIDFSSFNTSDVNDMGGMFENCQSLKSINVSSFNTRKVNNMSSMFAQCRSIESLDLSSFNSSNVTYMEGMFEYCSSLKSIDLHSFNTINVNDMSNMFSNCSSLKSIDLSSFDTRNVKRMCFMFSDCSSLKSIDLSSFDTRKVNDLSFMFSSCANLESINISSFESNNIDDMDKMFGDCSSLKYLDLSSFNSNNLTDGCIRHLFSGCKALVKENIKISKEDKIIKDFERLKRSLFDELLLSNKFEQK